MCGRGISVVNAQPMADGGSDVEWVMVGVTLVVLAVKSMKTTSGNLWNKRRSECRTHAIARQKRYRWGVSHWPLQTTFNRMIEKWKYKEIKRNSYKLCNRKWLPKSILPLICIADLVAAMSAAASIVIETGVWSFCAPFICDRRNVMCTLILGNQHKGTFSKSETDPAAVESSQ